MTRSLSYIEIDVPYCALRYGETNGAGTCPAVLGDDSDIKCFNTIKTCAVPDSFDEQTITLRYAINTGYLPRDIEAIPSISAISFTPATISLGEDLGQRATLTVTLNDHPHSDTGQGGDKYLADRDYDPFRQGSYWGKFRARQPFLQGRAIRWITGTLGQALAEMETRHFVIDSFDGPTPQGVFTLLAKDILKIADGDQSQAPGMSEGYLVAAVTAAATTLTLSPAGIGASYPASGLAAVGGKEIVSYTRIGDAITMTARGLLGTTASAFSAQDRFQTVLTYTAADAADIIYDLFVNYAEIPADYINLTEWKAETAFLANLYSANICDPVSVNDLVSELVLQACLVIWWDEIARKIRLQVLRQLASSLSLSPQNIIQGSLGSAEQPDKRLTQVWVYFGQINPLKSLTEVDNYRSTSVTIDEDAEAEYGVPVIKKIYSRWIPALGRTVADRLGSTQISRFRDPPRKINFDLSRYAGTDVSPGATRLISAQNLQDATGAMVEVPVQITRLNPPADRFSCEAEEIIFVAPSENDGPQTIIIDANILNVNLRDAYNAIYAPPANGDTITCIINEGVTVGSASASLPAFDVGTWAEAVTIIIIVRGNILGLGGNGGDNGFGYYGVGGTIVTTYPAQPGKPGSTAFYTRRAVQMDFTGKIGAGGGGGGGIVPLVGGGSGGGAGYPPGNPGGGQFYVAGQPGTETAGGAGGPGNLPSRHGNAGGNLGQAGQSSNALVPGGAAGRAIDGRSYITFTTNTGTILGAQVN